MKKLDVKLTTYMGEDVLVAGSITVKVSYNEQEKELDLLVVQGSGPSLLGRDWLKVLCLDWSHLHQITSGVKLSCRSLLGGAGSSPRSQGKDLHGSPSPTKILSTL